MSTLFEAIKISDNQRAKSLSQNITQPINKLTDDQNYTVLHIAASNSNYQMAEYFLQMYNKLIEIEPQKYSQADKKLWIDQKDNQGFCCLHYAVFRSNYNLALLFEKNGADIYAINSQGLNVLHISAQGDSPCLMFYYLHKGLKIGSKDFKGSTPLHWACYRGRENSASALIAWKAQIDLQDFTYGMTPLHLAVMSGNGRIVKKLLIKGCDRSIRAFNGKLALDLARQIEYHNIQTMIEDKGGIGELLNIKTSFRKTQKISFHFFFLTILFMLNYILNIAFIIRQNFEATWIMTIIFLALGLICILLFFIARSIDPGYLRPQEPKNFFQILKRYQPSKICYDCQIVKPLRSRHCQICQSCVSVYDHHCPWIGNCIGSRNYFFFYLFLLSLELFMAYTVAFEIVNILVNDWSVYSALDFIRSFCIVLTLLASGLFFLPLTFLLYVQTRNTCNNETTFQKYSNKTNGKKQKSQQDSSNVHIIQNKKSLKNSLLDKSSQNSQNRNSVTISMVGQKSSSQVQKHIQHNNCLKNCFKMCWGNKNNISYQVGGF